MLRYHDLCGRAFGSGWEHNRRWLLPGSTDPLVSLRLATYVGELGIVAPQTRVHFRQLADTFGVEFVGAGAASHRSCDEGSDCAEADQQMVDAQQARILS